MCPEAQRLRTHPGVSSLTALAFVLIVGEAERFQCDPTWRPQSPTSLQWYLRWPCP